MDIRILKYFLTVAEEQNFTNAAKKLHITQPTLSRQIKEFEKKLNVELFVRKNKKLYLTDSGLYLKKRAEEIVNLNQKTRQELLNFQISELKDKISIGCIEATNSIFLSSLLEEVISEHPQVTFEMYSGTSNDIIEKIDKGILDIALLIEPLSIDEDVYNKILLPESEVWGILSSNDCYQSNTSYVIKEDIQGIPLICPGRKAVQEMFYKWGDFKEEDLKIIGQYNLISNVISLVESNVGVALTIKGALLNKNEGLRFSPLEPTLVSNCVNTASKMYHLCNNFYQARQRNVSVSAKQCTTNTSCIM